MKATFASPLELMGRMMGFPIDAPASRMNAGDSEDTASARCPRHAVSRHTGNSLRTRMNAGFEPDSLRRPVS